MHDDTAKDASIARIAASGVLPGQRYRHYKTQNVYLVIAVSLFEADLEPMVHYRDAEDEYALVWTRHLDVFCGQAAQNDTLVPRFKRVE
jgi:hypothetical protein